MKLVDANVLLHAVNTDASEHATASQWMEQRLTGAEPVGFTWIVLLAFVRVGTRAGILPSPMSVAESFDYIEEWLAQPVSVMLEPTVRHISILRGLLEPVGTAGNLTSDAHARARIIHPAMASVLPSQGLGVLMIDREAVINAATEEAQRRSVPAFVVAAADKDGPSWVHTLGSCEPTTV